MFIKNMTHLQTNMFSFFNEYQEYTKKEIQNTPEYHFYHLILQKIPEKLLSVLYSDVKSRPNAAINCMVAVLILKEHSKWIYEELFNSIKFNVLTNVAFGLSQVGEMLFYPTSIFNFQNRLCEHFVETGEDLSEKVFDGLTGPQLKDLNMKTNIQRCDSTLAAFNI